MHKMFHGVKSLRENRLLEISKTEVVSTLSPVQIILRKKMFIFNGEIYVSF